VKVEEKHIKRCIELAKKGEGYVSPNPLVGAVIVKIGKVLGEGFHRKYGDKHAEVNVFENSVGDVQGATLYCNLEPCYHTNKQTPPCVPLIISKDINWKLRCIHLFEAVIHCGTPHCDYITSEVSKV